MKQRLERCSHHTLQETRKGLSSRAFQGRVAKPTPWFWPSEIITVNRYPCSHGTYILVNTSVRTALSSWLICPLILRQHATHYFCLSSDTASSVRSPGSHSIRGNDFFLQASMCPTCTFMTTLLLPGLHMRYIQSVKATKLDLDSGEGLQTRSASLSDGL